MRTGPAAGSAGYYHEALCYSSPEELLAVGLPFLMDGLVAGEPTLVAMGGESAEALRDTLPAGSGVEFLAGGSVYARPTSATLRPAMRAIATTSGACSSARR